MKQTARLPLPIDPYLEEIVAALADYSTIIVRASPGSGKTTRLPWAIARRATKKVLVLEPRRIAAKLAASRIAFEEGKVLGKEVGYHFRFEKHTSPESSLIFYTEGTFLKRFVSDPELSDVGVVILDEFHERHLETDLALAMLRDLQSRRPGLKLILMSATIDTTLFRAAAGIKVVEIEARQYKVDVQYLPNQPSVLSESLELKVKKAVEKVSTLEGDVLVFLPGMREILKVSQVLKGPYKICFLHGELSKEEQEDALLPSELRKIILATNIAESSVTIPGIRIVIDAGIQREAHYSPWNGLKTIEDSPTTKASAIQRAGRAGRTSDGVCLRLYAEHDYNQRPEYTLPEILRADLTWVYLELAATKLVPHWPTPPPEDKWAKARELCVALGAVTADGRLTDIGKRLLDLPVGIRSARILVAADELTVEARRELLRFLCEVIERDRSGELLRRLRALRPAGGSGGPGRETAWEKCVLTGFLDQVAKYRSSRHDLIHYSGKTLKAHPSLDALVDGFYIVFEITQRQEAISVLEIQEEWLWDLDPFPFKESVELEVGEKFSVKSQTRLGSILVEESSRSSSWSDLGPAEKKEALRKLQTTFSKALASFKETYAYSRLCFWAKRKGLDLEAAEANLSLEAFLNLGEPLREEELFKFLGEALSAELGAGGISQELPTKIRFKGQKEHTVHYPLHLEPFVEAPIQDFYGLLDTPTICRGEVELTLKLLGPHKRPVQITKDLRGFWEKTYVELCKEFQRDYPRHHWAQRPWEAPPILLKSQLGKK